MTEPKALERKAPRAQSAPAPLAAGDVVPLLRADLCVTRGASAGLYQVSRGPNGTRFTLYEFELSLARLLDGRRTAAQVVEHGVRLGIPVDLGGLHKFVRQLWHYGFLAPLGTAAPAGEPGARPERSAWDDSTRALFETGRRLVQAGRWADAAAYFEAVLDAHPGDPEATEMLAEIARAKVHGAPAGDAERAGSGQGSPRGAATAVAERTGPHAARSSRGAAPAPRERSGRALALAAALDPRGKSPRTLALAGAGAGLVVAAVVLALWMRAPSQDPAPAPAAPPVREVAAPAAPEAPPLPAVAAPPPPAVAPNAAPELPPPPAIASWRTAAVESRRRPQLAAIASPAAGATRWHVRSGSSVRRGDLVAEIQTDGGGASVKPELRKRVAELEALAAKDPVYRDFLEKARAEVRRASGKRAVRVVASAGGRLEHDGARRARRGDLLGRVVDPVRWQLAGLLEGEAPPLDAACEIEGRAGERAPCRLLEARPRGADRTMLTAEAEAAWTEHAVTLRIRAEAAAAPGAPSAEAPKETR